MSVYANAAVRMSPSPGHRSLKDRPSLLRREIYISVGALALSYFPKLGIKTERRPEH